MTKTCESVRSLLSGYLDGELSEEQAAPLRAHLLDCRACRETVQEGRVIGRWFVRAQPAAVEIPQGFAARTARRAFAGDPGHSAAGVLAGSEAEALVRAAARGSLLPFVLRLSAAAAVLLFAFSLLIRNESLPRGSEMEAQERHFWEDPAFMEDWERQELEAQGRTPADAVDPAALEDETEDGELDPGAAPEAPR